VADLSFVAVGVPQEPRLFGGKLLAQALGAATFTTPSDRPVHSLHGSFLLAGDGREDIIYEVERTRDGTSFSVRRVVARQVERLLFVATVSFHVPEPGLTYELPGPLDVPGPEGLPPGRYDSPYFDSRDVPEEWSYGASGQDGDRGVVAPHARLAWFRTRRPIPDDGRVHAQALAYLSDYGATRGIRQPHARHPRLEDRMSVSLSHSLWIGAGVRADDWLLSEFHPVTTGAGRGLTTGTIRTGDGRVLASMAQEALLRLPDVEQTEASIPNT
jgi:acyl-CoA thioesterase II